MDAQPIISELDVRYSAERPIRQGDILEFGTPHQAYPGHRFGIVLTADCDIQNAYSGQPLVYLRIVPVDEYKTEIWAPEALDRIKRGYVSRIVGQLNDYRASVDEGAIKLSGFELERWLGNTSPESIVESLPAGSDDTRKSRLIIALEALRNFLALERDDRLDKVKRCISAYMLSSNQSKEEVATAEMLKRCREALADATRDDRFFVRCLLPDVYEQGYFVQLNELGVVARDRITTSLRTFKALEASAIRHHSLEPTFKHALAQRFANLFQRIGLPDAHRDAQRTLAKEVELFATTGESS